MSGTLNIDDIKGLLSSMAPSNPKGTLNAYGTPIINTGTNDLSYDQVKTNGLLQQLAQQKIGNQIQQSQFASQPQIVGQTPDGQNIWSNPMTGGFHTDTGQVMADPNAVTQGAALARAQQGLNPGQSNEAQLKSDLMGKLSNAILNLPKEDQHTAYERAIGVLAGQGKLDIHDLPSWEQGGRDFMLKLKGMEAQGAIAAEDVKGQYGLQTEALKGQYGVAGEEAKATPDLLKAQVAQQAYQQGNQPGGNAVVNQLQTVLNNPLATPADKDSALKGLQSLGITGPAGSGLPVGDPVNARSIKTFNAANTALQNIATMSDLLQNNPKMSILGAKLSSSAGGTGNVLLTREQQSFNTLANHLNDSVKNIDGEPTLVKGQMDTLTKNLPTIGDKPETVAQKLNLLKDEAQNILAGVDPSGHISRILAPQQAAPTQPNGAADVYATLAAKYQGLTPQQINQMLANRQAMANRGAQSSVPLQPGDRMDYYQ